MALTDNLVAYWRLDEASGTRADSSGNGRSLSASGSPASRAGKLGDAADFVAASSQHLLTTDATVRGTITDSAGWTLAGWLMPDDTVTRAIAGNFLQATTKGLSVQMFAAFSVARELIVQWFDNTGGSTLAFPGVSFTLSAWNFWAVKYDPADDKLYVRANGTTAAGVSCAGKTFTQYDAEFRLGNRGSAPVASYWDGGLDDTGLWSRALSGAELDTLYNSGAGLDPTAASGQPAAARGVLVPGMNRDGRRVGASRIGWG